MEDEIIWNFLDYITVIFFLIRCGSSAKHFVSRISIFVEVNDGCEHKRSDTHSGHSGKQNFLRGNCVEFYIAIPLKLHRNSTETPQKLHRNSTETPQKIVWNFHTETPQRLHRNSTEFFVEFLCRLPVLPVGLFGLF